MASTMISSSEEDPAVVGNWYICPSAVVVRVVAPLHVLVLRPDPTGHCAISSM